MSSNADPQLPPVVRTIALIPARGGSKGVPGKNLRTVGGVPLVTRAVRACLAAATVDAVYVSTDDDAIAATARSAGAGVVLRPAELAGDTATSESALLHALDALAADGVRPEVLLFVQCTSPFLEAKSLDAAARLVLDDRADSAFTAVQTYEFLWRDADPSGLPGDATVVGVNHDAAVRPRRQDRRPDFRETGACYALRVAGFRQHRHRFFGRTAVVVVPEASAIEVDTPEDLVLADALAAHLDRTRGGCHLDPTTHSPSSDAPRDIDAVITDFDGVHTADTAYLDETGRESVRVSRSDGLGVARLRSAGVPMLILSKERNPVVTARASKLGVEVLQGVDDKAPAVREWLARRGIDPRRAAYLGNDVNDLEAMASVGWPVAVLDARPEVRAAARLTLTRPGGHGAVRELCDLVVDAPREPNQPPGAGGAAPRAAADAAGVAAAGPVTPIG